MKYITLFLFMILFIVIELTLISLPLFFIFMLLWGIYLREDQALVMAFVSGIFFDILLLRPIGYTSILFLVLLFIAMLYKRKLQSSNILFLSFWSFICSIAIVFFNTHTISIGTGIICAFLTLMLSQLFYTTRNRYEAWYQFL